MAIPGRILVVGVTLLIGSAMGCQSHQVKPCLSCAKGGSYPVVTVAALGDGKSHEYVILPTPAERLGQLDPQMTAKNNPPTLAVKKIDAVPVSVPTVAIQSKAAIQTTVARNPVMLPETAGKPAPAEVAKLAPRVEQVRLDHAKDYGWVEGELHYLEGKDIWQITYASLDVEDTYGGGFTLLASNDLLHGFKDGEFVLVQGNLLDATTNEPRPPYLAQSVKRQN